MEADCTREVPMPNKGLLVTDEPFTLVQPYADRQQIVVVPDEVVAAEREARKQLEVRNERVDNDEITKLILGTIAGVALREYLLPVALVELIVRGVMKLREGGIDVLMVGRSDVEAEHLKFAPGHPFGQVVYVGHPGVPALYYPAGEFHRRVFEHKFCEAVDLLLALGASKLTVERQEGFGREEAAELDMPLTPKERLGGKLTRSLGRNSQVLFESNSPGSSTPRLVDDMVWFDSERTWQTLASARMQHRAGNFSLVVRYENNYGITGSLKGKIEGAKLEVGGKFHEQQDTVWRISAVFPPAATTGTAQIDSGPQTRGTA
jgi:hypothetical protein